MAKPYERYINFRGLSNETCWKYSFHPTLFILNTSELIFYQNFEGKKIQEYAVCQTKNATFRSRIFKVELNHLLSKKILFEHFCVALIHLHNFFLYFWFMFHLTNKIEIKTAQSPGSNDRLLSTEPSAWDFFRLFFVV